MINFYEQLDGRDISRGERRRLEQLMLADCAVQIGKAADSLRLASERMSNGHSKSGLLKMASDAWAINDRAMRFVTHRWQGTGWHMGGESKREVGSPVHD